MSSSASDDDRLAGLRPVGDSLRGVVSGLRPPDPAGADTGPDGAGRRPAPGASAGALGGLFRGWNEAVGEQVAAHAQPVVLDGGRLVVEVDQPGWATQLRYLERDLLDRVRPLVAPAPLTSLDVRVKGARKPRTNRSNATPP